MASVDIAQGRRVFLLNIKPLYIENATADCRARLYSLPLFCQVIMDADLVQQIHQCRVLLVTHGLSTASQRCHKVSCFFEITGTFYPEILVDLQVTEQFVSFVGMVPPYKTPYFHSVGIPISAITGADLQLKSADLHHIAQSEQSALIRLIDSKTEQLHLLYDALNTLEDLKNQLETVNSTDVDLSTSEFCQYQHQVHISIVSKELQARTLEHEIETLCKQLLWRLFSIMPGDWLYSYSGRPKRGQSQIVYESASYEHGAVYVSGKAITQKGEVGKRDDSIVIWLKHDEHIVKDQRN